MLQKAHGKNPSAQSSKSAESVAHEKKAFSKKRFGSELAYIEARSVKQQNVYFNSGIH